MLLARRLRDFQLDDGTAASLIEPGWLASSG